MSPKDRQEQTLQDDNIHETTAGVVTTRTAVIERRPVTASSTTTTGNNAITTTSTSSMMSQNQQHPIQDETFALLEADARRVLLQQSTDSDRQQQQQLQPVSIPSSPSRLLPPKSPSVPLPPPVPLVTGNTRGGMRSRTSSWEGEPVTKGTVRVHSNLMRAQNQRDPMTIYEVVQLLGEGSMGSVAKVKMHEEAKGGSARRAKPTSRTQDFCCFPLFSLFKFSKVSSKFESPTNSSSSSCITAASTLPPSLALSTNSTQSTGSIVSDNNNNNSKDKNSMIRNNSLFSLPESSNRVVYGTKRETYYALKTLLLQRCTSYELKRELINEVEILKQLDHPNIVKAMETYDYGGRLFLVLELCSGGDLYTRDPYTEEQAAKIVSNLLSAVAYLHQHNIVHRDLKYENIMFTSTAPNAEIKLIDFGLSQKFAKNEHLRDAVGTVYTMAPELILGDYDSKADIWSLGVIAFMLLSSSMPFFANKRKHLIKKIVSGHFKFSSSRWNTISDDAHTFIKTLLDLNPKRRPTANKAQNHAWLLQKEDHFKAVMDAEDPMNRLSCRMDLFQSNIHAFAEYGMLKKLALLVIAYTSTSDEIGVLRNLFAKFDKDKNGEVSLHEFKETLSKYYAYTDEEAEQLFRAVDIDGGGTLQYCEFVAATLEALGVMNEERLAEAFDRIDADDTGYITVSDLRAFLGDDVPKDYLDWIINEADSFDDDHQISYQEFLSMWNRESDDILDEAKEVVYNKRWDVCNSLHNSSVSLASSMHSGYSENSSNSTSDDSSDPPTKEVTTKFPPSFLPLGVGAAVPELSAVLTTAKKGKSKSLVASPAPGKDGGAFFKKLSRASIDAQFLPDKTQMDALKALDTALYGD